MGKVQSTTAVLGKIVSLSLLGLATVLLAGPILAIVSVVLFVVSMVTALAFVGLFIWGLFQLVTVGPQAACEKVRHLCMGLGKVLVQTGGWSRRVVASLPRMWAAIRSAAVQWARRGWRTLRASVRLVGEVSLMVLAGAAIGGTLGAFVSEEDQALGMGIPFYALFGAVLAALAAVFMALRPKRAPGGGSNSVPPPKKLPLIGSRTPNGPVAQRSVANGRLNT